MIRVGSKIRIYSAAPVLSFYDSGKIDSVQSKLFSIFVLPNQFIITEKNLSPP